MPMDAVMACTPSSSLISAKNERGGPPLGVGAGMWWTRKPLPPAPPPPPPLTSNATAPATWCLRNDEPGCPGRKPPGLGELRALVGGDATAAAPVLAPSPYRVTARCGDTRGDGVAVWWPIDEWREPLVRGEQPDEPGLWPESGGSCFRLAGTMAGMECRVSRLDPSVRDARLEAENWRCGRLTRPRTREL